MSFQLRDAGRSFHIVHVVSVAGKDRCHRPARIRHVDTGPVLAILALRTIGVTFIRPSR